jgi:hypothetical protein
LPESMNFLPEVQGQLGKFSCPYRKNDPQKYSHSTRRWRICALASFDTIARVKYDVQHISTVLSDSLQ